MIGRGLIQMLPWRHPASQKWRRGRRSESVLSSRRAPGLLIFLLTMAVVFAGGLAGTAHAIENTASGSVSASVLDTSSATVILNLVGSVVDPVNSSVTVSPANVPANGTSISTITVVLLDANNIPVSGKTVTLVSDRGVVDIISQPPAPSDGTGTVTGTIRSNTVGISTITATTDSVVLNDQPQVFFTQGVVLDLMKLANKRGEVVGGVVTYYLEIRNLTTSDVGSVRIDDLIPPNFKYVGGSTRLDGAAIADPVGNRPMTFDVGTVPALADSNGNGIADPGESGYMNLSYQLVIGSGARPGDYTNTAAAWDVDPLYPISNTGEALVRVEMDPIFDLGTIIGKVFEDNNGNEVQDRGERGIADAMVVLDNGTYVLTDHYGRYHIPGIRPGHRMLKINRQSLPAGTTVRGDESHIVSVTPGLLVKVNFHVGRELESEAIGRPADMGLSLTSQDRMEPVEVKGSIGGLQVMVNGVNANLRGSDVMLGVRHLDEKVDVTEGRLDGPIQFQASTDSVDGVKEWWLTIENAGGEVVKELSGEDSLPESISWDGITDSGEFIGGGVMYRYWLEVWYRDGSYSASPRRTFGISRKDFVTLNISGLGFELGSSTLRPGTRQMLSEVAETLHKFPNDVVVIEGHTDSTGSEDLNLKLSQERAEAAFDHLVDVEGLSSQRFIVQWYGESRPIASNDFPEGQDMNRRVEVKGQFLEVSMSQVLEQYRADPAVMVDGSHVPVGRDGRFETYVQDVGEDGIDLYLAGESGFTLTGKVPVPGLEILDPTGEIRMSYGEVGDGYQVGRPRSNGKWVAGEMAVTYRLKGKTEPDNLVQLDNRVLTVGEDGIFNADLKLNMGMVNAFDLLVENPEGFTRIANLHIKVSDQEASGELIVVQDPIPNLSVQLPPAGIPFYNPHLRVAGFTDPGNRIWVGGQKVAVDGDGGFTAELTLVKGENLVQIKVLDPEDNVGVIQRTVQLSEDQMFFLAFADGKIGQLQGKGYLEGAGMSEDKEFYQEGRAAYYLKGVVAGKYLVTSAFDSGTGEFGDMFSDLDEGDRDRFFTNLDPDKYYPVYGDASDTTYDVQSQGKFYLAVDSEELHLLVGNYVLNLSDTELAAYQRTLYGGNLVYQSLARTKYGEHDTTVILFGAQARYTHIRDEVRATGGSLYYLSRREVTEGSEQVTLIIRDKNTGLMLAEIPQRRNVDYQVRYEEGRLLFNRAIASVVEDNTLIDNALLSGDLVSVQVDYEVKADSLERTSVGGRVKKMVGDNLAIGGTYIADELESGGYDLTGVDAKVHLTDNSWVSAEVAQSSGSDSPVFVSDDGGLTYTEVPPSSTDEGDAFKAALELDVGELFGKPQRLKVGGYIKRLEPGFQSGANHSEEGVQKFGADLFLAVTPRNALRARYDERESLDSASLAPGVEDEHRSGTLQWAHRRDRMGLTLEYRTDESEDNMGAQLSSDSLAAIRLDVNPTDKLAAHLEHQATLSGTENDQTTAGVHYQVSQAFSLGATGTHGTVGDSLQGEANLNVGDSRLYATERMTNDNAGHTSAAVLGAETAMDATTKVYTENQWERKGEGENSQVSLVGVRKNWDLADGLSAVLTGEASEVNSGPEKSSRYTVSTGLSYRNPQGLEAKVRAEMRKENGTQERVQYLTANQFKLALSPDYSLLGRYNYSITRDLDLDEVEARFDERSIGLAYRPVATDRLNLLSKYTELSDLAPDTLDDMESMDTFTQVLSIEWSFDITPRLEWVEKDAFKTTEEKVGDRSPVKTSTTLAIHRLNYNFLNSWDLGVEYRLRTVDLADDQQVGWLTELMYGLGKNFRIGLGYNFTDFSDNEFSANDYSVRGVFLRFQGKY